MFGYSDRVTVNLDNDKFEERIKKDDHLTLLYVFNS